MKAPRTPKRLASHLRKADLPVDELKQAGEILKRYGVLMVAPPAGGLSQEAIKGINRLCPFAL